MLDANPLQAKGRPSRSGYAPPSLSRRGAQRAPGPTTSTHGSGCRARPPAAGHAVAILLLLLSFVSGTATALTFVADTNNEVIVPPATYITQVTVSANGANPIRKIVVHDVTFGLDSQLLINGVLDGATVEFKRVVATLHRTTSAVTGEIIAFREYVTNTTIVVESCHLENQVHDDFAVNVDFRNSSSSVRLHVRDSVFINDKQSDVSGITVQSGTGIYFRERAPEVLTMTNVSMRVDRTGSTAPRAFGIHVRDVGGVSAFAGFWNFSNVHMNISAKDNASAILIGGGLQTARSPSYPAHPFVLDPASTDARLAPFSAVPSISVTDSIFLTYCSETGSGDPAPVIAVPLVRPVAEPFSMRVERSLLRTLNGHSALQVHVEFPQSASGMPLTFPHAYSILHIVDSTLEGLSPATHSDRRYGLAYTTARRTTAPFAACLTLVVVRSNITAVAQQPTGLFMDGAGGTGHITGAFVRIEDTHIDTTGTAFSGDPTKGLHISTFAVWGFVVNRSRIAVFDQSTQLQAKTTFGLRGEQFHLDASGTAVGAFGLTSARARFQLYDSSLSLVTKRVVGLGVSFDGGKMHNADASIHNVAVAPLESYAAQAGTNAAADGFAPMDAALLFQGTSAADPFILSGSTQLTVDGPKTTFRIFSSLINHGSAAVMLWNVHVQTGTALTISLPTTPQIDLVPATLFNGSHAGFANTLVESNPKIAPVLRNVSGPAIVNSRLDGCLAGGVYALEMDVSGAVSIDAGSVLVEVPFVSSTPGTMPSQSLFGVIGAQITVRENSLFELSFGAYAMLSATAVYAPLTLEAIRLRTVTLENNARFHCGGQRYYSSVPVPVPYTVTNCYIDNSLMNASGQAIFVASNFDVDAAESTTPLLLMNLGDVNLHGRGTRLIAKMADGKYRADNQSVPVVVNASLGGTAADETMMHFKFVRATFDVNFTSEAATNSLIQLSPFAARASFTTGLVTLRNATATIIDHQGPLVRSTLLLNYALPTMFYAENSTVVINTSATVEAKVLTPVPETPARRGAVNYVVWLAGGSRVSIVAPSAQHVWIFAHTTGDAIPATQHQFHQLDSSVSIDAPTSEVAIVVAFFANCTMVSRDSTARILGASFAVYQACSARDEAIDAAGEVLPNNTVTHDFSVVRTSIVIASNVTNPSPSRLQHRQWAFFGSFTVMSLANFGVELQSRVAFVATNISLTTFARPVLSYVSHSSWVLSLVMDRNDLSETKVWTGTSNVTVSGCRLESFASGHAVGSSGIWAMNGVATGNVSDNDIISLSDNTARQTNSVLNSPTVSFWGVPDGLLITRNRMLVQTSHYASAIVLLIRGGGSDFSAGLELPQNASFGAFLDENTILISSQNRTHASETTVRGVTVFYGEAAVSPAPIHIARTIVRISVLHTAVDSTTPVTATGIVLSGLALGSPLEVHARISGFDRDFGKCNAQLAAASERLGAAALTRAAMPAEMSSSCTPHAPDLFVVARCGTPGAILVEDFTGSTSFDLTVAGVASSMRTHVSDALCTPTLGNSVTRLAAVVVKDVQTHGHVHLELDVDAAVTLWARRSTNVGAISSLHCLVERVSSTSMDPAVADFNLTVSGSHSVNVGSTVLAFDAAKVPLTPVGLRVSDTRLGNGTLRYGPGTVSFFPHGAIPGSSGNASMPSGSFATLLDVTGSNATTGLVHVIDLTTTTMAGLLPTVFDDAVHFPMPFYGVLLQRPSSTSALTLERFRAVVDAGTEAVLMFGANPRSQTAPTSIVVIDSLLWSNGTAPASVLYDTCAMFVGVNLTRFSVSGSNLILRGCTGTAPSALLRSHGVPVVDVDISSTNVTVVSDSAAGSSLYNASGTTASPLVFDEPVNVNIRWSNISIAARGGGAAAVVNATPVHVSYTSLHSAASVLQSTIAVESTRSTATVLTLSGNTSLLVRDCDVRCVAWDGCAAFVMPLFNGSRIATTSHQIIGNRIRTNATSTERQTRYTDHRIYNLECDAEDYVKHLALTIEDNDIIVGVAPLLQMIDRSFAVSLAGIRSNRAVGEGESSHKIAVNVSRNSMHVECDGPCWSTFVDFRTAWINASIEDNNMTTTARHHDRTYQYGIMVRGRMPVVTIARNRLVFVAPLGLTFLLLRGDGRQSPEWSPDRVEVHDNLFLGVGRNRALLSSNSFVSLIRLIQRSNDNAAQFPGSAWALTRNVVRFIDPRGPHVGNVTAFSYVNRFGASGCDATISNRGLAPTLPSSAADQLQRLDVSPSDAAWLTRPITAASPAVQVQTNVLQAALFEALRVDGQGASGPLGAVTFDNVDMRLNAVADAEPQSVSALSFRSVFNDSTAYSFINCRIVLDIRATRAATTAAMILLQSFAEVTGAVTFDATHVAVIVPALTEVEQTVHVVNGDGHSGFGYRGLWHLRNGSQITAGSTTMENQRLAVHGATPATLTSALGRANAALSLGSLCSSAWAGCGGLVIEGASVVAVSVVGPVSGFDLSSSSATSAAARGSDPIPLHLSGSTVWLDTASWMESAAFKARCEAEMTSLDIVIADSIVSIAAAVPSPSATCLVLESLWQSESGKGNERFIITNTRLEMTGQFSQHGLVQANGVPKEGFTVAGNIIRVIDTFPRMSVVATPNIVHLGGAVNETWHTVPINITANSISVTVWAGVDDGRAGPQGSTVTAFQVYPTMRGSTADMEHGALLLHVSDNDFVVIGEEIKAATLVFTSGELQFTGYQSDTAGYSCRSREGSLTLRVLSDPVLDQGPITLQDLPTVARHLGATDDERAILAQLCHDSSNRTALNFTEQRQLVADQLDAVSDARMRCLHAWSAPPAGLYAARNTINVVLTASSARPRTVAVQLLVVDEVEHLFLHHGAQIVAVNNTLHTHQRATGHNGTSLLTVVVSIEPDSTLFMSNDTAMVAVGNTVRIEGPLLATTTYLLGKSFGRRILTTGTVSFVVAGNLVADDAAAVHDMDYCLRHFKIMAQAVWWFANGLSSEPVSVVAQANSYTATHPAVLDMSGVFSIHTLRSTGPPLFYTVAQNSFRAERLVDTAAPTALDVFQVTRVLLHSPGLRCTFLVHANTIDMSFGGSSSQLHTLPSRLATASFGSIVSLGTAVLLVVTRNSIRAALPTRGSSMHLDVASAAAYLLVTTAGNSMHTSTDDALVGAVTLPAVAVASLKTIENDSVSVVSFEDAVRAVPPMSGQWLNNSDPLRSDLISVSDLAVAALRVQMRAGHLSSGYTTSVAVRLENVASNDTALDIADVVIERVEPRANATTQMVGPAPKSFGALVVKNTSPIIIVGSVRLENVTITGSRSATGVHWDAPTTDDDGDDGNGDAASSGAPEYFLLRNVIISVNRSATSDVLELSTWPPTAVAVITRAILHRRPSGVRIDGCAVESFVPPSPDLSKKPAANPYDSFALFAAVGSNISVPVSILNSWVRAVDHNPTAGPRANALAKLAAVALVQTVRRPVNLSLTNVSLVASQGAVQSPPRFVVAFGPQIPEAVLHIRHSAIATDLTEAASIIAEPNVALRHDFPSVVHCSVFAPMPLGARAGVKDIFEGPGSLTRLLFNTTTPGAGGGGWLQWERCPHSLTTTVSMTRGSVSSTAATLSATRSQPTPTRSSSHSASDSRTIERLEWDAALVLASRVSGRGGRLVDTTSVDPLQLFSNETYTINVTCRPDPASPMACLNHDALTQSTARCLPRRAVLTSLANIGPVGDLVNASRWPVVDVTLSSVGVFASSRPPQKLRGTEAELTLRGWPANRSVEEEAFQRILDVPTPSGNITTTVVLALAFDTRCVDAAVTRVRQGQSDMWLTIPIDAPPVPPPPKPIIPAEAVKAAETSGAVAGTVAASVGSSANGAQASRAMFLLRLARCEPTFDPLDFSDHPTGVALSDAQIKYHYGAVVMNLVLIVGVGAGNAAVGLIYAIATKGPVIKSLAWARFPSVVIVPCMLFVQPMTTSAIAIVAFGDALATTVGVVVLFIEVGAFAFASYYFARVFKTQTSYDRHDASTRTRSGLTRFFGRDGEWKTRDGYRWDICAHLGALFDDYSDRGAWFAIVELFTSALLGVAAALTQVAGCPGTAYIAVGIYVLYGAALFYLRPHARPFDLGFTITLAIAQGVVAVFVVLQLNGQGSPALEAAIEVVTMVTMFLMVLRAMYDGFITARDLCFSRFGILTADDRDRLRHAQQQLLSADFAEMDALEPLAPELDVGAAANGSVQSGEDDVAALFAAAEAEHVKKSPPARIDYGVAVSMVGMMDHHEEGAQPLLDLQLPRKRRSPTSPVADEPKAAVSAVTMAPRPKSSTLTSAAETDDLFNLLDGPAFDCDARNGALDDGLGALLDGEAPPSAAGRDDADDWEF